MPNVTIKKSSLSKRVYDWSHESCGGEQNPVLAKSVATTLAYLVKTCQVAATLASVAALLDLALHIPLLAHAANHLANMRTLGLLFGTSTAAKSINDAIKTAETKTVTVTAEPVIKRIVEKAAMPASRVASTFFAAPAAVAAAKPEIKRTHLFKPKR